MHEHRITPLLTPIVADLGLELEAVEEMPAGKRRLLRIVLDGDGANGHGPSLDDIAEATKAISIALDSNDVTGNNPYTLEVTSRGVARPLLLPRHWLRNVGRLVSVTEKTGDTVTGRIVSVTDVSASLEVAGTEHQAIFADVAKALVQVEMNRTPADVAPTEMEDS